MTNYYVVLGVTEDADGEAIRSAFRALARRYHPDAGAGSSAAEFRRVLEAYETLGDPERRAHYDRRLRVARRPPTVRVEPLISHAVAESLFGSSVITYRGLRRVPIGGHPMTLDDLLNELFISFDRLRWR